MAQLRSPNYPALGLGEALDLVKKLWDKERQTPVSAEVALKGMGYGFNGASRMKLSALRKYGLLEGRGASIRVSDLAVSILHPATPAEKSEALRQAALGPELFSELSEKFLHGSDDALRSHLVRNGFTDQGAEQAIEAFRDTISVAGLGDSRDNGAVHDVHADGQGSGMSGETGAKSQERGRETDTASNQQGTRVFRWGLPGNREAELRIPGALTTADIGVLRKYLEVAEIAASDRADAVSGLSDGISRA